MSHLLPPSWPKPTVLVFGLFLVGSAYWAGRVGASAPTTLVVTTPRQEHTTFRASPPPNHPYTANETPAGPAINEHWARLKASPRTPSGAREMAAFLESLAATDPKGAMAMASAENNYRIREKLRHAVLLGWATTAPDEAAAFALALPENDRPAAVEAVFTGIGRAPEEAVRFSERLFAQDPAYAERYGQMLITALTDSGAYSTALRFATKGTTENHRSWLSATFYQWAAHQPDQATAALDSITDPVAHAEAFDAYVLGWGGSNGSALAAHAMSMPPGPDRAKALGVALDQWVAQDTVTAAEFIGRLNSSPDLDGGIASVATSLNMLSQWPELAAGLAESIGDPALRGQTLQQVARHWEERNPGAVRRFLDSNASDLRSEDRAALQTGLVPTPIGKAAPWAAPR